MKTLIVVPCLSSLMKHEYIYSQIMTTMAESTNNNKIRTSHSLSILSDTILNILFDNWKNIIKNIKQTRPCWFFLIKLV